MSSEAGARGTLWIIATPIGNLEDLSLRALRVLGEVALIACEDTRVTHKLLERHGITTKTTSCHEHNQSAKAEELVRRLLGGDDVAYVSDAGTPGVSDPGAALVTAAIAAGVRVVPIPGPSAVIAALVTSGISCDRFAFYGFPPARGQERTHFLARVVSSDLTTVLYEAPHRIRRTIADLAAIAPERRASVHRELTKIHEEVVRGTLRELEATLGAREPRGEYTVVVAGAPAPEPSGSLDAAVARARLLMSQGQPPSVAARDAAESEGVSRRDVYRAVVAEE